LKKKLLPENLPQWKHCKLCSLHKTASNHVIGEGDLPADILFIGEAPGPTEDLLGRPFVGPAGRILDSLLEEALPKEASIYITNVVACFPIRDPKEGNFRPPTAEEAAKCSPRLQLIYRLASPRLVVYLGKQAQKYKLRTKEAETLFLQHPSYILRQGGLESYPGRKFVLDLREAAL